MKLILNLSKNLCITESKHDSSQDIEYIIFRDWITYIMYIGILCLK